MSFDFLYDSGGITLQLRPGRAGLIDRLLARRRIADIDHLSAADRSVCFALAELKALADDRPGELELAQDRIRMSHALAALLDSQSAEALGLPPLVDLVFRTDVEGLLGSPSFRLGYEWVKNGQRQLPRRTGAILETSSGSRRIPEWLLRAVEVAEGFVPGRDDTAHWEALARFRQALDPGIQMAPDGPAARVSMTDFLQGLEVRLADRFSISPNPDDDTDFNVLPFSGQRLASDGKAEGDVAESDAELTGAALSDFQKRLRTRGALAAYRVGEGSYLVVDRSATPALQVMAEMQHAPPAERTVFIANPRPKITEAIEESLRRSGKLAGLSPSEQEEIIETAAGPIFVETKEYSDRVTGREAYRAPDIGPPTGTGTTWLPESIPEPVAAVINGMGREELQALCEKVRAAVDDGVANVEIAGRAIPADDAVLRTLEVRRDSLGTVEQPSAQVPETVGNGQPIVIQTRQNFDRVNYRRAIVPRRAASGDGPPAVIRTMLKDHQRESFAWQVKAWRAGLPGVLNADEQGLGKTLQTIAFLRWLKDQMADERAEMRGPVLVVAPTSLLQTWETEVQQHLEAPGLGPVIRLFGSGISAHRRPGSAGTETGSGEEALDLDDLKGAITEGRGHRFWLLTTYATLTNYHHSLAGIPFSVAVFDEIQALKNPVALRAVAARAINADFRIGLTGTPIENSTRDLWAIMDQLAPGQLDSLKAFRDRYDEPGDGKMQELHGRLFLPREGHPPFALRRLKDEVAKDLPAKARRLHPRPMPAGQAAVYEEARLKLAQGGRGSALKMLHHIRSVSVHPALSSGADEEFIAASGRLAATFDILRQVRKRRERALVFIEHRRMQHRFIELARQEFGLNRIDLINGDTPIRRRQEFVDHFQRHLDHDGGFDLLVLGPRAAGTGLTLTAATHVIHLSRWWNPAVEEQCNDRVHRIGQTSPVTVHVPMAIHSGYREHSFDCLLHSLMTRKRRLATSALWPMGDTGADAEELQKMVSEGRSASGGDPVGAAMRAMFERDGVTMPPFEPDGSLAYT